MSGKFRLRGHNFKFQGLCSQGITAGFRVFFVEGLFPPKQ